MTSLASSITKAASAQTYYTIRFLVDRPRVADAYRAYAYFRWVDDVLDADGPTGVEWGEEERVTCARFLDRQRSLLADCLRGAVPRHVTPHEGMLVELARHAGAGPEDEGLRAYLRNMMLVMEFDVRRRGRLVSNDELSAYTGWLATAVTEAMHHFIGHGAAAPRDETRYLAVTGAHILHMLRDTYVDLRAGYYNVPREVLETNSIGPSDVASDAYRTWVQDRVELARACFDAGRSYFARVHNVRHRLAGLAYIARFEWLIETLERERFTLRPQYPPANKLATAVRTGWLTLAPLASVAGARSVPTPMSSSRDGRP